MNITITFFAGLKDFFGNSLDIEIQDEYTIDELFAKLSQLKPKATNLLKHSRVATTTEYILPEAILRETQLFILPPSSGG